MQKRHAGAMVRMPRWVNVIACGLLVMTAAPLARAAYPDRPIRIVVGFTAGGPTDVPARRIAGALSASLNVPVIVENKPGAGGKIAAEYVLSQPADGYTLLLCSHVDSTNAAVYRKISYTAADLAPVSLISRYNYAIAVASNVPADNLQSFIRLAKQKPGEFNYAQVGVGSGLELLSRRFQQLADVTMTSIPYKGTAEAVQDVLVGRTHFILGALSSVQQLADQGRLKLLAVTSRQRLSVLPSVPSATEAGVPLVGFGWLGICAPKATSASVINLLNKHVVQGVAGADYKALIIGAGAQPVSSTPTELGTIIHSTFVESEAAVKEFGIQLD